MLQNYFGSIYYVVTSLDMMRQHLENAPSLTDEMLADVKKRAKERLKRLKSLAAEHNFPTTVAFIEYTEIADHDSKDKTSAIIHSIIKTVENEGDRLWCHLIARHKWDLYEKENTRWEKIAKKFPNASSEAISALMCHSIEEDTAAVFHMMRAAEIGLRALARERKVKISKKPLEWADWNDILTRLKTKIDAFGGKRRGPTKDAALEFYRGAFGQFESFKDVYRNNVMHVRKTYDEHQAASVIMHVGEFFVILSEHLDEKIKSAIKWGRF